MLKACVQGRAAWNPVEESLAVGVQELSRVARELIKGCLGVAWKYGGSCSEVAGELIQSCSGVGQGYLGGAARELLGGVTRKVSQGCSGS